MAEIAVDQRVRRPATLSQLTGQVGYAVKTTLRNPMGAFFTVVFPLMFLILLNALLGDSEMESGLPFAQVFSPGIAVFAVVNACLTNLAISVTAARDMGILKRVRGTPLPGWIWMAGRISAAVIVSFLSVTLMMTVAALVFDVQVVWSALPAAVVTVVLGSASFCALGLAATALVTNADSAPAVLNILVFPILFVSGIFFPLEDAPDWLTTIAKIFPIYHLAAALQADFNPATTGAGFEWNHLAIVALWGAAGLVLALRFFRWEKLPGR